MAQYVNKTVLMLKAYLHSLVALCVTDSLIFI